MWPPHEFHFPNKQKNLCLTSQVRNHQRSVNLKRERVAALFLRGTFFVCVMLENWILNDDVGLGLLKESSGNLS